MGSRKDSKGRVLRKGESQREKYYIFQYMDVNHKRKVVYAKDLPELRIKEKNILRDLEDGLDVSKRETMTLNAAFDYYVAFRTDLKHTTKLSYNYLYTHYVRDGFGNKVLAKIRYSDVKVFYTGLVQDKQLSKKTLLVIDSLISQVMRSAVRDNILRTNPVEGVMKEIVRRFGLEENKRHPLSEEEQRVFLKHAMGRPEFERWVPILIVFLGTGCRIGEVLGLRWNKDVDFEAEEIHISHSLLYRTLSSGKAGFYISTPKSKSGNRTIPMMKLVKCALEKEKKEQEFRTKLVKGYRKPVVDGYTDFVFTRVGEGNGLYTPQVINRAIKNIILSYNEEESKLAEKENRAPVLLPHFSCHHLRHTFCQRICENETDLKVIQDLMGHANIVTTMNKYAEAAENKKRESIANLENKIMIM